MPVPLSETHTVVIVDDVPEIREILGFLLEESGWFRIVGYAGSGEEAIDVVERERPDIVLLDLDLPGMGGWDVLPILRERHPGGAVVVLSGSYDNLASKLGDVHHHAAAVLEKGVSNRDLTATLLEVVGKGRGAARRLPVPVQTVDVFEPSAWLRAIVEASADAVIGKTLDGTIVSWNPAAERLYGYTSEEAVGHSIAMLMPRDRPDELDTILASVVRGERLDHYETVRMRKDGSRVDVSLTVSPVWGDGGEVVGASIIARDVSSRRQTEAALARAMTQLERRNRDLLRSNEELDSFAAVASHDLAQPLQVAYGFLDMLRTDYGEQLPEQGQAWLEASVTSLERMRNLVKDILRYARTGSGEGKREHIALGDIVGDALGALSVAVSERGAQVTVGDDLPAVVGDRGQLALVVQNLLANAIKFVPEGRAPQVTVHARQHGNEVELAVADNGVGIAPDQRAKVFEMFQRVASAGFAGSGLGLAIVKKIVTRHGGDAWVDDGIDGMGATIRIRLPAADAPA
ncbi:MAG TPA: PAS domain S-box protein [Acidimicrobiales bacterium]